MFSAQELKNCYWYPNIVIDNFNRHNLKIMHHVSNMKTGIIKVLKPDFYRLHFIIFFNKLIF